MTLRRFVIEREIPKVGSLEREQLRGAAQKSNEAIARLAPDIQSKPPLLPRRLSGTAPPDPERADQGQLFHRSNAMIRAPWNTGRGTVAGATVALAVAATVGAAALAETGRSVLIVLDASGSMNQPMPEGRTRLEAAKAAVGDFLGTLASDVRVGLRVYGHQSSPSRKNCEDSELVAGFASVGEAKVAIIAKLA